MGMLFAIISMLSLGVSTYLYKKGVASIGPINNTFYYYLFGAILSGLLWLFFKEKKEYVVADLLWPFLIAVFLFISILTFSFSLKYLNVSIASTIRGTSFLATILMAIIFSKERLVGKDFIAIALALIAVLILGMERPEKVPVEVEVSESIATTEEKIESQSGEDAE